VSLSTSTWLWLAGCEWAALIAPSVSPPLGLEDSPRGVPLRDPGAGCAVANDEVVTTYDYGPDAGPNNLLLRGKSVSADGQVQRICYGHDHRTNKIWETSPNANRGSCPNY